MSNYGPNNLAVFVCSHVFDENKPVLYVTNAHGDWQFMCGDLHDEDAIPKIICVEDILKIDPKLESLADLPKNWEAQRSNVGGEWVRKKCKIPFKERIQSVFGYFRE